jgi:hypothetical protein
MYMAKCLRLQLVIGYYYGIYLISREFLNL